MATRRRSSGEGDETPPSDGPTVGIAGLDKPLASGALTPWQVYLVIRHNINRFQWKDSPTYSRANTVRKYPRIAREDIERQRLWDFMADAVGVALAESKGDPAADNSGTNSNGSTDYGLFQINSIHKDTYRTSWSKRLDANTNTIMAAGIFNAAHGWSPWATWPSPADSFKQYGYEAHGKAQLLGEVKLDNAFAQLAGILVPGGIVAHHAAKGIDAVTDIGGMFGGIVAPILGFLQDAGVTVGAFLLGLILVLVGAWALLSETDAGKAVMKAALP